MTSFQGFPSGKTHLVPIPAAFFTEVLPQVDDVNTVKLMLHIIRLLDAQERAVRYIRVNDLMSDDQLLNILHLEKASGQSIIMASIKKAVDIGFVLQAEGPNAGDSAILFLNSARGRDALAALKSGKWVPDDSHGLSQPLPPVWPGIFRLYEDNIGPLTPMLADILQEAEKTYPQSIIQYAFEEAVKKNARNWKYIDSILRNWQQKGSNGQNSRDSEKDRRKYIEGEYAEFINHE